MLALYPLSPASLAGREGPGLSGGGREIFPLVGRRPSCPHPNPSPEGRRARTLVQRQVFR